MEHVGYAPGQVHGSIHTNKYNHLQNNAYSGTVTVSDAETAFHDYSIEWTPSRISFAVDSTVYFTYFNERNGWVSWPFDQPFHLLLNIAIGGNWGGIHGIDDSIFPQQMVVDYVRVYRYLDSPQVTLSAPATLTPGDTLNLSATASDTDGTVQQVVLRQADGVLAQLNSLPYDHSIPNPHEGCYTVTASATDDQGWITYTDTLALAVGNSCEQAPYLIAPHSIPGRIEAEYFDLGGQNHAYLDITPDNRGDGIRQSEAVEVYYTQDGAGFHVFGSNREWLSYTVAVEQDGYYSVFLRLSTRGNKAAFTLAVDGQDKVSYDAPNSPDSWTIIGVHDVELTAGTHNLRLTFDTGGTSVNWLRFNFVRPLSAELESPEGHVTLGENFPNPFIGSHSYAPTV